jgi:hypothetical protein
MIRIRKPEDTDPELKKLAFNIVDTPLLYWGNKKMLFFLVKLKDLKTQELL